MRNINFNHALKAMMLFCFIVLSSSGVKAQLSGTKNIPGDYATLDLAITDLNTQGVGPGGVTINLLAGNPQTAPAGGYTITASGTIANPIAIVGNANVITASSALTAGSLTDAIFKIVGGDFIGINAFVMQENPANTTTAAATNNMTEWGVALLYATATNGAQNNGIVGNTISLNLAYTNTFGIYSNTRHTATVIATAADITAPSGSNSGNRVYSNLISNVNYGIVFNGSNTVANMDQGNDIGGTSASTGNTITNYGNAAAASGYINLTGSNYGIFLNHQLNNNISYNTLTSSVHATTGTLGGILQNFSTTAPTVATIATLNNNTVTLSKSATSGGLVGVNYQGISTAIAGSSLSMNNNQVINCVISGASSSSALTGVTNLAAVTTLNMTGNIVRSNTSTATSGGFTGVSNTGAVTGTINLNNNQIGNATGGAITYSVATSGTFTGVLCSGAGAAAVLNMNSNNIQGITYNVASSATNNYISCSAVPASFTANLNTFTNLNVNTTGTVTFVLMTYSTTTGTGTKNVTNNSIVTGFTRGGTSGSVLLVSDNGSSSTGTVTTVQNNNFSNINVLGSTTVTGINLTDGGTAPTKVITNNTLSNWTGISGTLTPVNITYLNGVSSLSNNTISSITNQGAITGINIGNTVATATSFTISNNTITGLSSTGAGGAVTGIACANTSTAVRINNNAINTLSSTGASLVNGIAVTGATNTSVFANKIYGLSTSNAAGTVYAIQVTGGTLVPVYNNTIGNLTASVGNGSDVIRGISVSSTTASSAINVYYNTIYLNASSSGTNFGTTGIFHTANATATTAALDLRNNIVVNESTANGTGLSVAYRRSGVALNNYAATSDRNDFFAPVIFNDGTNSDLTLAAYQIRVATRDANSVTTSPVFLSAIGSNSNFLHINPTFVTSLESGGANIAGITNDFDGDTRQGNGGYTGTGTAPDIGADEFELAVVNCAVANGGTISPATASICVGSTSTMTSTGATSQNGITYQWKVSTTAGGPYSNVVGGTGATTATYTTAAMTAGTYYFVMEATCSFGPVTGLSNEFTLVVNANPTVAVTPNTATYCTPGPGASLTASGAVTYSWSPAAGLSATTGATVAASPTGNSTYTVLGTDVNGCTATATATISVAINPVISSVTATPAAVCSGSNSQLQANATISQLVKNYSFSTSTGATLDPMTGATTVLTSSNDDTPTAASAPIGFNFTFNGTSYSNYSVSPDGWILLGNAVAAAEFTNAVTSTTNIPRIYPFWDDLATGTDGNVKVLVTGTAPNRIFITQWSVTVPRNTSGAANSTFQTWLYETSNVIEFRYGTMGVPSSGTISSGLTAGATNFNSVTYATNTASGSTANDVNAIAPATGRMYTFTPPSLTYSWSPIAGLSDPLISNPIASNVVSPTTYTISATSGACSVTGNVSLTINPLPSAPTATNSAQCGTQVPTASVTSTTGAPTPTFNWYDAASAGTLLQSSTSTTYTSNVATTTTLYVSEVSALGCESVRTPVTITVAAADPILASVNNATICIGSSIDLSVVNTNPTPLQSYTYTWSGTAGSGLTSQGGTPITVTPTLPGTYTYNVTAVDGGCNGFSSVNVTVNPFTATLAPINVSCNGYNNGSFSVATTSCGTLPYTYSIDGGAFGAIPTNLAPGTYSVEVKDDNGYLVAAQNVVITQPSTIIATPTGTNASVCQASGTAPVSATSTINTPVSASVVVNFTVATQPTELSASSVPATVAASPNAIATATLAALPAGAVVTGATLNYNGITATGNSWQSDVRLGLVGAVTQNYTAGTGTLNSAGLFNYVSTIPAGSVSVAGGTITMHYFDFFNDNAAGSESTFPTGANVASITINYTVPTPATISWWNASSAGTQIGTGSPFETVGTSVLPNTNTPGVYTVYAQGEFGGCSGVTRTPVTVTVKATSASTTTATACGSYTWTNGTTYTTSGTHTQTLVNAVGCDSIATLNLTINNPTSSTVTAAACNSYTWAQNGTTYTTSGSYPVVLAGANANGCDSTVTLILTINQPTSSTVTVSACSSYTWAQNSTTYTVSGSYPVLLAGANANGCDSTVTLNLTINQPTTATVSVSACGSYTWALNTTTYTTSGSYVTTLAGANANGCDSTVTLNLTINQPTTSTISASACGSYTWADNATTYTTSGSYVTTLVGANANGCDSTITLNLTINQPTSSTVTVAACGSYTWAENTTTYTTSGSYPVVLAGANANGCDSTVTLVLTINQPTSSTVTVAACGSYTWAENTTTYTTSGSYPVVLAGANANGCDSTVTLILTINQPTSSTVTATACESYTWAENGTTYTASGSYPVVLAGANANGCDSTVTLVLTITGLPTATATDNGDATITASTGTSYQWINCATNTAIAGATSQTYTATANGDYAVVVTNAGGCSDTSSCVTIDYIGLTEITDASIQVFPNPTNSDVTITMTATEATVEVVDAQGKLLQAVTVVNGEKVNLSSYETGVYFLRIRTVNGSTLERVVKQQ